MVSWFVKFISILQGKPLPADITLQEVKKRWEAEHYPRLTICGSSAYEYAWSKVPLKMRQMPLLDLRWHDWQEVINVMRCKELGFYSQKRIKNFCGQIYKFAIKNELCKYNYASMLEMGKNIPKREKSIYTKKEIQKLLENIDDDYVKMILILIFTGVRISELLRIKPDTDVFLKERYFIVRESKTVAGTNRPIPIHVIIRPAFKYFCSSNKAYLVSDNNGDKIEYSKFRYHYIKTLSRLGLKHTIHECRHTFASLLDDVGANDMCIKKILGHVGVGVTQKVYTHKNLKQLFRAVDLIKI